MTTSPSFLPYGRQSIDDDDIAAVVRVLQGDFLTTGPTVEAFEAGLCRETGAPYAVACANGTAALHLALLALDVGPGDRVVVPTLTFAATANAARLAGAEVVFADVDPTTGLLGPVQLQRALDTLPAGGPIKAVLPVHLNGQPVDMDALRPLAEAAGAVLIEDACHAVGAVFAPGRDGVAHPVGACHASRMTCFSFHPVKTVAMGEGGAVTTADSALAERLRLLRSHGISRDPKRFTNPALALDPRGQANPWYSEMLELGLNYRVSDINCALGLSQLGKITRFLDRRRQLAERYDAALVPLAPLVRPLARVPATRAGWHLYVVQIDFAALGLDRAQVMDRLRQRGIGTQVHYLPVHCHPYYQSRYGATELPGAMAYYAACLSLPLYPSMADGDVDRVVEALGALIPTAA